MRNILATVLMVFAASTGCNAADRAPVPAPTNDSTLTQSPGKETAIFATAGYAGGSASTATYEQVSREDTGHAESVKVVFDPSKITYGQLLQIFFSVAHDPTQLNRQGPDVGSSYRSVIFYTTPEQQTLGKQYIAQLDQAKVFRKPIVTEVVPLKGFYDAESYHQDYALHNPNNPYIMVCDRPKIDALKKEFPEMFKDYRGK
jgi:peptide-methionine (S)-S-oxide reductase